MFDVTKGERLLAKALIRLMETEGGEPREDQESQNAWKECEKALKHVIGSNYKAKLYD
jgi:hypothetical protein